MDAPRTYTDARASRCLKKEISPDSIAAYLSRIDQWYTEITDQSRDTLIRYPSIPRMQHFLNANFKCRDQQVHSVTFEILEKIVAAASRHELDVAGTDTNGGLHARLLRDDSIHRVHAHAQARHVRRNQVNARLWRDLLQGNH